MLNLPEVRCHGPSTLRESNNKRTLRDELDEGASCQHREGAAHRSIPLFHLFCGTEPIVAVTLGTPAYALQPSKIMLIHLTVRIAHPKDNTTLNKKGTTTTPAIRRSLTQPQPNNYHPAALTTPIFFDVRVTQTWNKSDIDKKEKREKSEGSFKDAKQLHIPTNEPTTAAATVLLQSPGAHHIVSRPAGVEPSSSARVRICLTAQQLCNFYRALDCEVLQSQVDESEGRVEFVDEAALRLALSMERIVCVYLLMPQR
ncbi:hypothetical protein Pelo_15688 [Pelomyxa schiedti]|nr:hypothetical protein Pelo_15688 [Pelomyxa schiedti]